MAYADPQWPRRGDAGGHDRVIESLIAVELVGPCHAEVIAGAAADEGHAGPEYSVRAAEDLLLVTGQTVAQEQEGVVRMISEIDKWRDAPLWDPESIARATSVWFSYLGTGAQHECLG